MRAATWIVVAALFATGCAHLDYVGESAAPTRDVHVYYTEANVPRPYRVMGEAVATANLFISSDKIQKQMVEKARERGADAVVILGMETYQSGESSSYSESSRESKDRKGRTRVSTSGSSSTSAQESKKVRALFIRWKPEGDGAGSSH